MIANREPSAAVQAPMKRLGGWIAGLDLWGWLRLALGVGLVAVVATVVVVLTSGEDPVTVETTTRGDYPSRGGLVGDQALLERAAGEWQVDAARRERDGESPSRPGTVAYLVFAGAIGEHRIVVLSSGDHRVTYREDDRSGYIENVENTENEGRRLAVRLADDTVLLAKDAPTSLKVVTLPRGSGEVASVRTAEAPDGVVEVGLSGYLMVPTDPAFRGWDLLATGSEDGPRAFSVRDEDKAELTATVSDPAAAHRLYAAVDSAVTSFGRDADRGVLAARVLWRDTVEGTGLVVAVEVRAFTSAAVAVGHGAGGVVLGSDPSALRSDAGPRSPVLASGWLSNETSRHSTLLVIGDQGVARLAVLAGNARIDVPGSVAVLPGDRFGPADQLPDIVVIGYRADGQVVAPLAG